MDHQFHNMLKADPGDRHESARGLRDRCPNTANKVSLRLTSVEKTSFCVQKYGGLMDMSTDRRYSGLDCSPLTRRERVLPEFKRG